MKVAQFFFFFFAGDLLDLLPDRDPLLLSSRIICSPFSLAAVKASLSNFGLFIDEAKDSLSVSWDEFRLGFFNWFGELIGPEDWLGRPIKDLAFSPSDFRPNFTSAAY